ncbi:hypothetical protein GCM10010502_22650 [Kitasatospora aureofaciens]|uniref:Uncharacterized protein n=1 Tax=Kitasatospora aureofaciens TaxID=1894 RepID=A0A8H9HKK2_KITAU|nr:hypothetical protein GCM10010502_22650 [Kitasatospora aureofaciens]
MNLGEPGCTGGCCGYLSAVVQRIEDTVPRSDRQLPVDAARPPEYTLEADRLRRRTGPDGGRPVVATGGPSAEPLTAAQAARTYRAAGRRPARRTNSPRTAAPSAISPGERAA